MIDSIRTKLMARWADADNNIKKWRGNFSPRSVMMYEDNMLASRGCSIHFNGDDSYEVIDGNDRHVVYIDRRQCTCRAWDLTGIPCPHAIAALIHANIDPVSVISRFYHRESYLAAYRVKFKPCRGQEF